MRVLILGASGMLGRALMQVLNEVHGLQLFGASRSRFDFPQLNADQLIHGFNVLDEDNLIRIMNWARPNIVINAIGVIKQLDVAKDPLQTIPINAILPHRLAALCDLVNCRLVHVSTDCVFNGERGNYAETDRCDATDLYGVSKFLGEVIDAPHVITLRTSIIGREFGSKNGLVEWLLSSHGRICGFRSAIFSGLPTVELSRVIAEYVIPDNKLHGLFHVGADPIDKNSLVALISQVYGHDIEINPIDEPRINRSLNSDRFRAAVGYSPKAWPELIQYLHEWQP